jgi:hypothetical protein
VPALQATLEHAAAGHGRDELDADAGVDGSADQWGAGAVQVGVDARLDVAGGPADVVAGVAVGGVEVQDVLGRCRGYADAPRGGLARPRDDVRLGGIIGWVVRGFLFVVLEREVDMSGARSLRTRMAGPLEPYVPGRWIWRARVTGASLRADAENHKAHNHRLRQQVRALEQRLSETIGTRIGERKKPWEARVPAPSAAPILGWFALPAAAVPCSNLV